MDYNKKASELLKNWKKDSYLFGFDVIDKVGPMTKDFGNDVLLVGSNSRWAQPYIEKITKSLKKENISYNRIKGAKPNCPREDVYRMAIQISLLKPDCILVFGGGSSIDGIKAANVLATFTAPEVSKFLNSSFIV